MDDWVENGHIGPFVDEKKGPNKITALAFDSHQELLWLGLESGQVTSYIARDWSRYTSYMTDRGAPDPVKQILFNDKGIAVLSQRNVQMRLRRAVPVWKLSDVARPGHAAHDNMSAMECMAFVPKSTTRVLVAGGDARMLVIDIGDTQEAKLVHHVPRPCEEPIVMLRSTTLHIVAASVSGMVYILDPSTYAVRATWKAHQSKISDMCVNSDFVVTCGYVQRENKQLILEHFLHVYSLSDSTAKIVSFPPLPLWVCCHSVDNSTVFVLSQHGQIHMVHLDQTRSTSVKQTGLINNPGPGRMQIASTMQAAAIVCEDQCRVVVWSSPNEQLRTCSNPQHIELPSNTPWNHPKIEWTPETPLHVVGMPYYTEELLSAWPEMWHMFGRPPVRLDHEFLAQLKQNGGYLCGINPRKGKILRNQIEPSQIVTKLPPKDESRYLSQTNNDAPGFDREDPWRFLSIRFSKFGFNDFDFRFFNNTLFSGLTNHLSNSYANPLLQLLRFTPVLRNKALLHLSGPCESDACLLCELGFLFDMMEKARGSICQATNFLRALAHDTPAQEYFARQREVDKFEPRDSLQHLTRFLIDRLISEYDQTAGSPQLEESLSIRMSNRQLCQSCNYGKDKDGMSSVTELLYPSEIKPSLTFSRLLKDSIERDVVLKGWCDKCRKYRQIHNKKAVVALPDVFVVNAMVNKPERKKLWEIPGWLPAEVAVIVNSDGQPFCYQGPDIQVHLDRGVHRVELYSLVGVASAIDKDSINDKAHMVATINTSISSTVPTLEKPWYVMNDFLVRSIDDASEALSFDKKKTPSVLVFQAKKHNHRIDDGWKTSIDTSLLFEDDESKSDKPYRVLDATTEPPRPGTIVALDSEFVSVGDEGIAIASINEDAKVERPSPKTVARLSVIRGEPGPDWGLAFIDDYIRPKEQVRDYLTEFSGIVAEDLDPRTSNRHLVPLKVAIKKLWILLNLGCRFVGHGLANDFRELNLIVPKEQRIDTVELFQSRVSKRRLGLSFLLWCVFGERIQKTTHDSIEDARAALKLYEKFLEYRDQGVLGKQIEAIFARGQAYNFRVPKEAGPAGRTTPPSAAPGTGALAIPPSTPIRNNAGLPGAAVGSPYSTPWSARQGSPMP